MTEVEIEQFRRDFASIVYLKSQIIDAKNHLAKMSRYDNNGSHEKAILKAIDKIKELKQTMQEKLKGHTYEEWQELSKKLSKHSSRLKAAISQQEKAINELNNLNF